MAAAADRPKLGRPPRISRQMIAEAAHELGLEQLTLRAVADHLGVSVPALYHYVDGRDDLLRLAADHAASLVPIPVDHGQHWARWLLEWARYNRDAFESRPGLLAEYLDGAITPQAIAGNIEAILGLLVAQGFSVAEANAAYELVSAHAIGAAIGTIRERQAEARTGGLAAGLAAEAERRDLPNLTKLLRTKHARQPFDAQVATVIAGIAIRRGDDCDAVLTELPRPRH